MTGGNDMELKKHRGQRLLLTCVVFTLGISTSLQAIEAKAEPNSLQWDVVQNPTQDVRKSQNSYALKDTIYKDNDTVRVMIVFKDKALMDKGYSTHHIAKNKSAIRYIEQLEDEQEHIVNKISNHALDGKQLDVRRNFTIFTNAISAEVTYKDISEIEKMEDVVSVFVLPQYQVQAVADADPKTVTSGEMVGSYNTWNLGFRGAGQRIAVIDTGLDLTHPSFDENAFLHGLKEEAQKEKKPMEAYQLLDEKEIAGVLEHLSMKGASAKDLYKNKKVAFGYNYVDKNLDITHNADKEGDHGTHVSGIATANVYVPKNDKFEKQENGVVGIAPDAQLLSMKVFGQNGGAYSDDYMAAIQDALLLHADAINLSLGSSNGGNSKELLSADAYINDIFDKLEKSDTVVSISAGNEGLWAEHSAIGGLKPEDVNFQTNGSPGSYTNAFTVASADNIGNTGYALRINDAFIYYTDGGNENLAGFYQLDTEKKENGTTHPFVLMKTSGKEEDYKNIDVKGKIVIVRRGDISFVEKHEIAEKQGAIGLLVYNNEPGSISMDLSTSSAKIPCTSITQADASAIQNNAQKKEQYYEGKMQVSSKVTTSYNKQDKIKMSKFSSWGISTDLSLKPEITAPGGNIYSTRDKGSYGLMSGTSMAAPGVAGMSALVLQYIENNDLVQKTGMNPRALTHALLMSTATPIKDEASAYSPRKQGAGLANVEHAITTPAYIVMKENGQDGKVKAELGDDPKRKGTYRFTFTLHNLSDETQYYALDSETLTEALVDGLLKGKSYALHPNVSVDGLEKRFDLDNDLKVDKKDASLLLAYVNGAHKNEKIQENQASFDFNKNGLLDSDDVHQFLNKMENDASMQEEVLALKDKKEVTVNITLSKEDREYLDKNFKNGMFVEGYVYLNGKINLSVPFMGFYGNWQDASMFEHKNYLQPSKEDYSYTDIKETNLLTVKTKNGESKFGGNAYAEDEEYLPERNAIRSDTQLASVYYSLIRNAADVNITMNQQDSDKIYKQVDTGYQFAAFYHEKKRSWENAQIKARLDWDLKDEQGQALKEGTKLNVNVEALTEYGLQKGVKGKGSSWNVPMTIDNSEPAIKDVKKVDPTHLELRLQDNHYAAAVLVLDKNMENILSRHAINQKEEGKEMRMVLEVPQNVVHLAVVDYAGNMQTIRVNNTGREDTQNVQKVILDKTNLTLAPGESAALKAEVLPEEIMDDRVVWSSSNEEIASVDKNGVVHARKEGEADIIATSVSKNAQQQSEQAICKVKVDQSKQKLISFIQEDGQMYWGQFERNNPEKIEKLMDSRASYVNATAYDKKVMAMNVEDGNTVFYQLDPAKAYTEKNMGSLQHTVLSSITYADQLKKFYVTGQKSILSIDFSSGDMKEINLEKNVKGNLTSIAYMGTGKNGDSGFIFTDTKGTFYMLLVNERTGQIRFGEIASSQHETADNGCAIYYNPANDSVLWSAYDGKNTVFYQLDLETQKIEKLSRVSNKKYAALLSEKQKPLIEDLHAKVDIVWKDVTYTSLNKL